MESKTNLKSKTLFGFIWSIIQQFGGISISFLSNIVLARLLTPDDYGYIGMIMIFISISGILADGGFGTSLIQKTKPSQVDYSTVFFWNLFISTILYAILFFTAPIIADFYNLPLLISILRVLGIIIILGSFNLIQMNMLMKQMKFKQLAITNLLSSLLSVIIAIILAFLGFGVWALVFQQISSALILLILLSFFKPWKPTLIFSYDSFKTLGSFGAFMFLANATNTVANNVTGLIVGKAFNASTLGYLTQAKKIETVASTSISQSLSQVTYPLLVEVKHDYSRMSSILQNINRSIITVISPLMFLIALSSYPLINFLFGSKWLDSAPILQILCYQGIFLCLQTPSYQVVAAIGKSKSLLTWTVIKRLTGICLWIIGLIIGGFYGLLISMIVSAAINWLCNAYLVQHYIKYSLFTQIIDLSLIFIVSFIPFLIIYWLTTYFTLNPIIGSAIYLMVYLSIFLLTPFKGFEAFKSNIALFLKRK